VVAGNQSIHTFLLEILREVFAGNVSVPST